MASVTKDSRGRSPYWTACYTDSTGRRLKKSTKLTNKQKAIEVALALEHGEGLARRGAFSEARLRDLLEETLERVVGTPTEHYTIESWLRWWLEKNSKNWASTTAERYAQVCRGFITSLGSRAKLPLEQAADKDVLRFRNSETGRGLSNKSANLSVKIVSMAFHDALRQDKLRFNPCHGFASLEEDGCERDPFALEEVRRLLKAAVGDWKIAVLFGYYTGARLSDIANMTWSAVDWNKRAITFLPRKTGRRKRKAITVPLHPQLEKQLLKNPGVGSAPIFPTLAGRASGGAHGLSEEFKREVMLKAGVRGRIVRHTPKGRANETKGFHSFRHSFTSALANAGIAREMRQALTGHASERMNEIYTHREIETVRQAIVALPSV